MKILPRIVITLPFIFLLANCGGGGNSSRSDADNTPKDIYDIASYPSRSSNNSNLTGTWLFVAKYDMEYRDSFHDENEHRQNITSQRALISIVDDGVQIEAYSDFEDCCYVHNHHTWKNDNDELVLTLERGHFVGKISDRSVISGEITGEFDLYNQSDDDIPYIKINSSSAGLVKLSSTPSLNGEKANLSWGTASSSLTSGTENEATQGNIEINAFSEEVFTWRIFENQVMIAEDNIYQLYLHHVPNGETNENESAQNLRFSIRNNIKDESENETLGWKVSTPVIESLDGIATELVTLSTIDFISGSYTSTETENKTFSMDFSISFSFDD